MYVRVVRVQSERDVYRIQELTETEMAKIRTETRDSIGPNEIREYSSTRLQPND